MFLMRGLNLKSESEKAEVLPGDAPIISTDGSISTADFKARITGIALLGDLVIGLSSG